MKKTSFYTYSAFLALSLYGVAAHAHTFGADNAGFVEGLIHPFIGLDHLLAMLAIGIWAGQSGRSALWQLPLAFVGTMTISAVMATSGPSFSQLELSIASTVMLLGLLLLFAVRLPTGIGMLIAGLFAVAHGYAHGLEIPETASAIGYGAGFVAATSLLHLLGIALYFSFKNQPWLSRASGFAIAASGIYLTSLAI
ncbi:MAG: HupE/UreJ family protein [Methylomicrobium sp.]